MTPEQREQQFAVLREAQDYTVSLTNWHEFLKCLTRAGFRSSRMISSENALLYSYVLWLIGRRDYHVELPVLREVIARWFFMAHTTGRYTTSPESQIESDLLRLRELSARDGAAFCEHLDREVATVFTSDYWGTSLPNRLQTSGAKAPALVAYWAALNLLDGELLFSTTKVATRLDPGVNAVRDVERHHLFPKQHLEAMSIRGPARTNQVANMAFIDWAENGEISAKPPATYWPIMSSRVDAERLKRQRYWHALPVGWEQLSYDEFLDKRRKLVADVIRDGFKKLLPTTVEDAKTPVMSVEELIKAGESVNVEFKATARWNVKGKLKDPRLEHVIVKTVAAFMNNEGGTLLIGVSDSGEVLGLQDDYQTLNKPNRDGYELFLGDLFKTCLSGAANTLVRTSFATVRGQDVCRLDVAASGRPVFARSPRRKITANSGCELATARGTSWART